MSPTPWNDQKQVPNFALGIQSTPRMDSSGVSRRSSNASDYDKSGDNRNLHVTSSNDDLISTKSSSISRGSKRLVPLSHPAVDVPLCMECQALESTFFDPGCINCTRELKSISHVMAALRQWVPQVQQAAEMLIDTALKLGAHPDDRDAVTDMTLLMYACKSGAAGVGNTEAATRMTKKLLCLGASSSCRCKWTDMSALHYASYFDVGPVLTALLITSKGVDVDITCQEYENGTSLHIAATNLSIEAAKVLIAFDSDPQLKDELARMPIDCIPDEEDGTSVADIYDNVSNMIDRRRKSSQNIGNGDRLMDGNSNETEIAEIFARANESTSYTSYADQLSMPSISSRAEETKIISQKMRILLMKGLSGLYKAFPEENKNHQRMHDNRNYDNNNRGNEQNIASQTGSLSASVSSITDNPKIKPSSPKHLRSSPHKQISRSSQNGPISSGNAVSSKTVLQALGLKLGDRILVNENKLGTLQFCGPVEFAGGTWAGVELDEPEGKNDGRVNNITYFTTQPGFGVMVPTNKVEKIGKNYRPKSPTPMGNPKNKIVNHGNVDISKIGSRITEAQTIIAEKAAGEIRVGDRVSVSGLDVKEFLMRQPSKKSKNYQPIGTIRFVGSVDFVDDDSKWYGVELDDPVGRHDGTVQGVRYFAANDNHGVFVVDSKLTKLKSSSPGGNPDREVMMATSLLIENARRSRGGSFTSDENINCSNINQERDFQNEEGEQSFSMNYHTLANNADGDAQNSPQSSAQNKSKTTNADKPVPKPRNPLRRSLSAQHRATKGAPSTNNTPNKIIPSSGEFENTPPTLVMSQRMIISSSPAPTSMLSRSSSRAGNGRLSRSATVSSAKFDRYGGEYDNEKDKGPGWTTVPSNEFTKFTMKRSPAKKFLETGATVIYINTKEMALVKYVGRVSFAEGIWVGLELKQPRTGRHDGCVEGRRYFTCGANKGVMVRPKTVSVHGINGSDLIKPLNEYPF